MNLNLKNLFSSAPPVEQAAPQARPANPGNLPDIPNSTVKSDNPNELAVPLVKPVENKSKSPIDEYSKLWHNDVKDSGSPANSEGVLTEESVQKIMSNKDFTSSITQDQLKAIEAGGEGAAVAFKDSLNGLAKNLMTQQILIQNELTKKAVLNAREEALASIPELLKSQTMADHMYSANPLFKNPAVKPVADAARSQLQTQHPDATPSEITKMVEAYIKAMGEEFTPKATKSSKDDIDWSTFLS